MSNKQPSRAEVTATLKLLDRWPIRTPEECKRILNAKAKVGVALRTEKHTKQFARLSKKVYRRLARIDAPEKQTYWLSYAQADVEAFR